MHGLIDPHRSGFQLLGDFNRSLGVAGPNRPCKTVIRSIRAANDFVDCRKLHQRHDWAKLFLSHNPRIFWWVVEHGNGHEIAWDRRVVVAAGEELIALVLGILNQLKHPLILRLVLDRSNRCALLGAVADLNRFGISRNRA